jgi:hypothetical protein
MENELSSDGDVMLLHLRRFPISIINFFICCGELVKPSNSEI